MNGTRIESGGAGKASKALTTLTYTLLIVLGPLLFLAPAPARALEPPELIRDARAGLKAGDYDQAAQNLKAVINGAGEQGEYLEKAYLLLVQTYVMRGNYYKSEPQGRETAELFYREARRYVEECFRVPALRHVRPDPVTDYPPEMVDLFTRVRSEMLGSFRIQKLTPPDALVIMDGDTLYTDPADSLLEEKDLPVGPHRVLLRRHGYKDLTETIQISPGAVTERTYLLSRRHGTFWYASRSAVVLGGAAAIVASRVVGGGSGRTPATPLPEPPSLPR